MKKLYRKGTVHPSPAPPISDSLALLPATLLTLSAALSPEDREVLAYLISCSSGNLSGDRKTTTTEKSCDHSPSFSCDCFRCYMSFWIKWDSSPNRQLIHEIIDQFEDDLAQNKKEKSKKERKKKRGAKGSRELKISEKSLNKDELIKDADSELISESDSMEQSSSAGGEEGSEGVEKGTVRRFMSFVGERFWSVWTQRT
ncbi:unnamed protein product [Thlaspi arvense]|uniref:Uncharacterized protein n=1 Tax=Thlaspi arvense TaxID=13288 RepID=A0AAU9T877_THLAR|nr:unnamed protein product [Thlaspi arvense]